MHYEIELITKSISIFLLTFYLVKVLLYLINNKFKTIYIIFIVYYIFFIFPLILDLVIGVPNYSNFPGFSIASKDNIVKIYYNLLILVPPLIWMKFSNKEIEFLYKKNKKNKKKSNLMFFVLILISFLPLFSLVLVPDISSYYKYGSPLDGMSHDSQEFHAILKLLTTVSLFSIIFMLFKTKEFLFLLVLISPILMMNFWINGKRSIVVIFLVMIFFIIWKKRNLKGIQLIVMGIITLLALFIFTFNYQSQVRSFEGQSFEEKYENFRIDFGRDDSLKLAILKEISGDESILEHRGQSLLFYSTMYVPRSLWKNKPLPYAQYFTSALFFTEPKLWGWGMTTSVFDESIANFGFIGMIIGSLLVLFICRISDLYNNIFMSLLSIIVSIFFLTVHLVAFFPVFLVWICFWFYFSRKQKSYRKSIEF